MEAAAFFSEDADDANGSRDELDDVSVASSPPVFVQIKGFDYYRSLYRFWRFPRFFFVASLIFVFLRNHCNNFLQVLYICR